ncbi:hypothetical protein FOZ63_034352 [Perkinsus olseni]|uniref:Phytase-like domain-containing protein n=1 Tax=Perkinsus olseni TaxID=32597 RepID=A0A7J6R360_PEROL|nr:hypothetical protein FOZ63_034352 [Perkinsus olseni]
MSIASVFSLAALLGSVAGQGTIVNLNQRSLPFWREDTEVSFDTPHGTLEHVQTLELRDADDPGGSRFRGLSSLLASPDGLQLLAISDRGVFIRMTALPTVGDRFVIREATIDPMYDTNGRTIRYRSSEGDAEGLAVEGTYEGGGAGDLIVSYEKPRIVLKFPDGVESRQSQDMEISEIFRECPSDRAPEAILSVQCERGSWQLRSPPALCSDSDVLPRGSLLMFCPRGRGVVPPPSSGNVVFLGFAYDGRTVKRFYVEFPGQHELTDVAQLSDGDTMILFRRPGVDAMIIAYITQEELQEALASGGTLTPDIILNVQRRDGYNVAREAGMAVREDPTSGRIFVNVVNKDTISSVVKRTQLTTFEWKPKRRAWWCRLFPFLCREDEDD